MTNIERSWADAPRTRMHPTNSERTTTMKHFTKARTITVAVATGSAVVLAGGVAYAVWTATGSGSGAAKSATAQAITVTAVTPGTGDLYPGGTGAVAFTLTNANAYNTSFTKLTAASVTSSDNTGACAAGNVSITPAIATAISGGGYTLPSADAANAGGTPSATYTIPGLLTMSASAADGCQGRTFTVSLTLTGSQV
jgi:hypothetical protein